MEEGKPKSNVLSYVIIALLTVSIILLMLNLGATAFLILRFQQTLTAGTISETEPLPAELRSTQERTKLFEEFKEPFNNRDSEKLYSLLDPLAQVEISREQFDQQLPLLYEIGGNIESAVYSHYDYMGISNGRKWFVLFYRLKTDQGPSTLRITVAQGDSESYTVMGFHIGSQ